MEQEVQDILRYLTHRARAAPHSLTSRQGALALGLLALKKRGLLVVNTLYQSVHTKLGWYAYKFIFCSWWLTHQSTRCSGSRLISPRIRMQQLGSQSHSRVSSLCVCARVPFEGTGSTDWVSIFMYIYIRRRSTPKPSTSLRLETFHMTGLGIHRG